MLKSKPILRFGLTCIGFYLLFILLGNYTGLGKKYGDILRSRASATFTNSDFKVRFKKNKAEKFDTKIELTDKKKGIQSACSFNTWMAGYLPTVLICALILATPMLTIKRKLILLAIGLLLITIYIFIGMKIKIVVLHQQIAKAEQTFSNSFMDRTIDFVNTAIIDPVSIIFLVPVIFWALIAFRRSAFESY